MDIESLVKRIATMPNCAIYPPNGLPSLPDQFLLPDDLLQFYQLCGGAELFREGHSFVIVPPERFIPANDAMLPEKLRLELKDESYFSADRSWWWYVVVEAPNSDYLFIDLAKERLGQCYWSYWETYATPGEAPIIAKSFSELLLNLLKGNGDDNYWEKEDFESLGDAYD